MSSTDDGAGIDGALLDTLQAMFQDHCGPDNAITSGELADRITGEDSEANPKTREAIRVLIEERGVPIAAGPKGYYRLESIEQFEKCLDTLDSRINGIQPRKQVVCEAWNRSSDVPASQIQGGESA